MIIDLYRNSQEQKFIKYREHAHGACDLLWACGNSGSLMNWGFTNEQMKEFIRGLIWDHVALCPTDPRVRVFRNVGALKICRRSEYVFEVELDTHQFIRCLVGAHRA